MRQLRFIIINYLYMFRASIWPSSGVQVVCYLEIIYDNKCQLLHQVGTPRHFRTIYRVTHTLNLLLPNRQKRSRTQEHQKKIVQNLCCHMVQHDPNPMLLLAIDPSRPLT
jgi:hypothetical protein